PARLAQGAEGGDEAVLLVRRQPPNTALVLVLPRELGHDRDVPATGLGTPAQDRMESGEVTVDRAGSLVRFTELQDYPINEVCRDVIEADLAALLDDPLNLLLRQDAVLVGVPQHRSRLG